MRRGSLAILLALALLVMAPPAPAQACSCGSRPVWDNVRDVDVVAVGRMEAIDIPENSAAAFRDGERTQAVLIAERYFKGSGAERLPFVSSYGRVTCGFLFHAEPGERWIVFLHEGEGGYTAPARTGSVELVDPRGIVRTAFVVGMRGPGIAPGEPTGAALPAPALWAIGASVVAGVVMMGVVYARRTSA